MNYIEINKYQVPYQFEINLANETFQFNILYNSIYDFFTINLYKDHRLVRYGEKIVYNVPLFENLGYLDVPKLTIIPADTTKQAIRVTYENMNEDVFLYVK